MTWCIEWNTQPQSKIDSIHFETVEKVAERNRRMLEQGNVPSYFVVGVAATPAEARQFADAYKAQNPRKQRTKSIHCRKPRPARRA